MTETLKKFINKATEYGYETKKDINEVFTGEHYRDHTLNEKIEVSKRLKRNLGMKLCGLKSGFELVSNSSRENLELNNKCYFILVEIKEQIKDLK